MAAAILVSLPLFGAGISFGHSQPSSSATVVTTTTTDPRVEKLERYVAQLQRKNHRWRLYARKQEKLRSVQMHEIRKIRALIPQPFWVPAWFKAQALCIHRYESRDWRNRGHHFGGMQFTLSTWASVGGRGNPADASPAEQIYRAFLVWKRDGGSWVEWSTRGLCGL